MPATPSGTGVLSPSVANAVMPTMRDEFVIAGIPMLTRVMTCSTVTEKVHVFSPHAPQPGCTSRKPGPAGSVHSSVRRNIPRSTSECAHLPV